MTTAPTTNPVRAQTRGHSWNSSRSWLFFCGFVAILVYWSTVQADFVQWDDDINLYRNPHLAEGVTREAVHWAVTDAGYVRRYMPLGWLGWLANAAVDGMTPTSYHLGNILLHAANTMLLFAVVLRLLRRQENGAGLVRNRQLVGAAVLSTLCWALHPLRVEPVAWASGRLYVQAGFFALLATWCYLRHIEASAAPGGEMGRRHGWLWASASAYAATLLTYPLALGWVAVIVCLDLFPARRLSTHWRLWGQSDQRGVLLEKVPFLAAATLVVTLTLWARTQAGETWRPPPSLDEFGWTSRFMQAFFIWGCYLWKTLWPADLSPLYTTLVSFDPWEARFCWSAGLVVGLTLVFCGRRQRWPGLGWTWLAYLAVLFPVLGWTDHPHYPSDRYSYLAALVWAPGLAWLLVRAAQRGWTRLSWGGVTVGVAALAWVSMVQCGVWRTSETLFRHMLVQLGEDPRRFDIHHRLGQYYMSVGRYVEAEAGFRDELALRPNLPRALFSLGNSQALQGRMEQAAETYAHLGRVAPDFPYWQRNLGHALAELGRWKEAASILEEAVRREARDDISRDVLAQVKRRLTEAGHADRDLRQVELDTDSTRGGE